MKTITNDSAGTVPALKTAPPSFEIPRFELAPTVLGISLNFNLTEDDLRTRARSFLNHRTLEGARVCRVGDDLGHQILGISTRQKGKEYSGILIPYFDIPNLQKVIEYSLRRDKPEWREDGKGERKEFKKYVKPRTTNNLLYVPPMTPRELIARADVPKVFFEGEFKALAAARVASEDFTLENWHFIPLAISGVDNFRTKQKQTLADGEKIMVSAGLPEFNHFAWHGSKVVILFDSDIETNKNVKAARARLKTFLQEKGAKVFFADLPNEFEGTQTKGFDDYLGAIANKRGDGKAIKAGLELITKALIPNPKESYLAKNYKLIQPGETDSVFHTPGVWYDDGETMLYICSPLAIEAETQTEAGENYGRFLKWTDSKNRVHTFAMPIEKIHGDNSDFIKYLASRGLQIAPTRKHYDHLKNYINLSNSERTIISTDKIGWNGDAFVLPNEVIGGADEITFQSEYAGFDKFQTKGSLSDWRDNIGVFCAGNSRLVFAVSTALACPLLPIAEVTGGGFHYRGTTSTGKTTALLVAGSVCGGSDEMHGYCQTWKSTANGLEILAAGHNHLLLALDEIGECEAREIGNIAYMLSNGQGKNRMARNTARRKSYNWHLLFLSSGERRLSDIMTEAGQRARGGQEIRLCDIEADTGHSGMFENLHDFSDGREFSDHLRECSRNFYGTPLREFLRQVVEFDREDIKTSWRDFQDSFFAKIITEKQPGEVLRVASRFALVAFAGEMATGFGLTGWSKGEAMKAAFDIFRVWYEGRLGKGNSDGEAVVSEVRAFIERHGSSRFQWLGREFSDMEKVVNRIGFKRKNANDELEYLFTRQYFSREVCKGYDAKFAALELDKRGFLVKDGNGNLTRNERCAELGQTRVYVVNSKIFADSEENEM